MATSTARARATPGKRWRRICRGPLLRVARRCTARRPAALRRRGDHQPPAGSVYYLEGRGGNIGLSVGEDGVVMIDDQFAPLTDRIVAAIREISDDEIRFPINTHVHGDHTGGNENLGRMGVLILARDQVRVRLLENAAAARPTAAYDARWGEPDRFLRAVYAEVGGA